MTADELPGCYAQAVERDQPVFVWNDCEDPCLLVAVGDEYAYITLLHEGTFYSLVVSDDTAEEIILIGDVDTTVPRRHLAPRETGLAVLLRAPDIPGLLTDYPWEPQ
ncbi:MAG TPA: hypothetical protein VL551_34585 [Actinospica sp.]|nr:hypothetical protein [Actinospica sp.]